MYRKVPYRDWTPEIRRQYDRDRYTGSFVPKRNGTREGEYSEYAEQLAYSLNDVGILRSWRKPIEIAEEFGVHVSTVYGWIKEGILHIDQEASYYGAKRPRYHIPEGEILDLQREARKLQPFMLRYVPRMRYRRLHGLTIR